MVATDGGLNERPSNVLEIRPELDGEVAAQRNVGLLAPAELRDGIELRRLLSAFCQSRSLPIPLRHFATIVSPTAMSTSILARWSSSR